MSDLNPVQFGDYVLSYGTAETGGKPLHIIRAHQGEEFVGSLRWDAKQVRGVDVVPDHQRRGLATAMWNMGQEMRPAAKHSADRTDAGDAWARAVGGRLPRRKN